MVIDYDVDQENFATVEKFFSVGEKIVVKGNGSDGRKNFFIDLSNPTDVQTKLKTLQNCRGDSFVAEKQIMHAPLPEDVARFSAHARLGVYYRDLVIFNPSNQTVECIPVYRNILDILASTDSHITDRKINLEETAFMLDHSPAELKEIQTQHGALHPEFYAAKERAFLKIGATLLEYTQQNHRPIDIPTRAFFEWYHDGQDQWEYYQYFLQVQRGEQKPTGNDVFDLKLLDSHDNIDNLQEILLDKKKSLQDRHSEFLRELYFLSQVGYSLYSAPTELFFLYCAVKIAALDKQSPLHALWKSPGFFQAPAATDVLQNLEQTMNEIHNSHLRR